MKRPSENSTPRVSQALCNHVVHVAPEQCLNDLPELPEDTRWLLLELHDDNPGYAVYAIPAERASDAAATPFRTLKESALATLDSEASLEDAEHVMNAHTMAAVVDNARACVGLMTRESLWRARFEHLRLNAHATLQGLHKRFAILLQQTDECVILIEPRGTIEGMSRPACQLFGGTLKSLTGLPFSQLLSPESKPVFESLQAREAGTAFDIELTALRQDDSLRAFNFVGHTLPFGALQGIAIPRHASAQVARQPFARIDTPFDTRLPVEQETSKHIALLEAIRDIQSEYIEKIETETFFRHLLVRCLALSESEGGLVAEILEREDGSRIWKRHIIESGAWEEALCQESIPLVTADTIDLDHPNTPQALHQLERAHAVFLPEEQRKVVILPMHGGTNWVGAIMLAGRTEGYDQSLVDFLKPLTHACANIFEAHRQSSRRRNAENLAAKLGRILENTLNEIVVFDSQTFRILEANLGARKALGYSLDELRELTLTDLLPQLSPKRLTEFVRSLSSGAQAQASIETLQVRKDGELLPVEIRLQYSDVEPHGVVVALLRDITRRKNAEEQLNYLFHYDSLTGLPNRLLLLDRLNRAISDARESDSYVAVMFLDLDRFKGINDTLGHEFGDSLLTAFSERLKGVSRPGYTIARLGGDEFAFVLPQLSHLEEVARVAQRILMVSEAPFLIAGHELYVTASIGIAVYPNDSFEVGGLLKHADTALHHAKRKGSNSYKFFTSQMNLHVVEQLALETDLRRALERDEFEVHYQPQVSMATGTIDTVEALLRWNHPYRGMISPERFIELAEETGLVTPIGAWVLERACKDCEYLHRSGHQNVRMSVNLSARQLNESFTDMLSGVLQSLELPSTFLELEITETQLMQDPDSAIASLKHMQSLGISFAIDDFGTGYSSLSYIKRLPINTLKVDRSFVRDITTDKNDAAIVSAIIAMAHRLGLMVVAEGVETREQLRFLEEEGCDSYQGYLFSKALPLDALEALLEKHASS